MANKDIFSIYLATLYLIAYIILLQFETTIDYAIVMSLFSPLLICWMVYSVLRYSKYNGPELGNEEFGYRDKIKDDLGIF
jgi:hypothetical protein